LSINIEHFENVFRLLVPKKNIGRRFSKANLKRLVTEDLVSFHGKDNPFRGWAPIPGALQVATLTDWGKEAERKNDFSEAIEALSLLKSG
jgi:hypothetical protein